jgi:secondary thiamine-phosphate synthase enzyme
MQTELRIETRARTEMIDITAQVQRVVGASGVQDGICVVYVPHTTAGVTINEHADPSVAADILYALSHIVPALPGFRHLEGNSDAHVKASLTGASQTILIEGGRLQLGRWQGIFLCEFDGPRQRTVWVKVIAGR